MVMSHQNHESFSPVDGCEECEFFEEICHECYLDALQDANQPQEDDQ
jgi:hypothetical protein